MATSIPLNLTLLGTAPLEPKHITHDGKVLLAVTVLMTTLSTLFVIARLTARKLHANLGLDDGALLAAMVCVYGVLVAAVLVVTAPAGYHVTEYSLEELERFLKYVSASQYLYPAATTLSKLSVVLLYARVFAIRPFLVWTWIVEALLAIYFILSVFFETFALDPVEAQWKPWLPHKGIDEVKSTLAFAAANTVLDFIVLAMPQFRVWKLHQTLKRKAMVSIVFLLGGFVCIASILRLVAATTVDFNDITFTYFDASIWSAVEVNMAIICACLPTLPILYRHWFSRSKSSSRTTAISSEGKLSNLKTKASGYSDLEHGRRTFESSSTRELNYSATPMYPPSVPSISTLEPARVRNDDRVDAPSRQDSLDFVSDPFRGLDSAFGR